MYKTRTFSILNGIVLLAGACIFLLGTAQLAKHFDSTYFGALGSFFLVSYAFAIHCFLVPLDRSQRRFPSMAIYVMSIILVAGMVFVAFALIAYGGSVQTVFTAYKEFKCPKPPPVVPNFNITNSVPVPTDCSAFHGIMDNDHAVCCASECKTCGGPLCGAQPGGADGCCVTNIVTAGKACGEGVDAPCVIEVATTKGTSDNSVEEGPGQGEPGNSVYAPANVFEESTDGTKGNTTMVSLADFGLTGEHNKTWLCASIDDLKKQTFPIVIGGGLIAVAEIISLLTVTALFVKHEWKHYEDPKNKRKELRRMRDRMRFRPERRVYRPYRSPRSTTDASPRSRSSDDSRSGSETVTYTGGSGDSQYDVSTRTDTGSGSEVTISVSSGDRR